MNRKIILASTSPRRREILSRLGVDFEIITSDVDENIDGEGISPELYVQELALLKGQAVVTQLKPEKDVVFTVIAADTMVIMNGKKLGKPQNRANAREMLREMSGKTHKVMTGICIWEIGASAESGKGVTHCEITDVTFKELSEKEIEDYLDTDEYIDKAGAYGIQGEGRRLVEKTIGDYYNVVGLPVKALYETVMKEYYFELFDKEFCNEIEVNGL